MFYTEDCPLGPNQTVLESRGGGCLKIVGCKIEGLLYGNPIHVQVFSQLPFLVLYKGIMGRGFVFICIMPCPIYKNHSVHDIPAT